MRMEIRYIEDAIGDVRETIAYLEERSPLTARRFELELEGVVAKLARHPEFGFPVGDLFRKALFRTLPWSVVHRIDRQNSAIWVVVVRHRLLHPSLGMGRNLPPDSP